MASDDRVAASGMQGEDELSDHSPALGVMLDNRLHITWITPELSRAVGLRVGDSAAESQDLPWTAIRHFVEAAERVLETGQAEAWFEPGQEGGLAPSVTQILPLPLNRGLVATFAPMPADHPAPKDL